MAGTWTIPPDFFSEPAQLAFMLTGPMFDLKLLLMYEILFRRKAIVWLAGLILGSVFLATMGLVKVGVS